MIVLYGVGHEIVKLLMRKEDLILTSCRCWSYVGDLKNGKQQISIGSFCYFHGIVVHEIGHALGLLAFVVLLLKVLSKVANKISMKP